MLKIIGHKRQVEYLKKVRERGTFAHAYLFFGPENVGKLHIAHEWAKLFFESADWRAIDENRHPDFIYLSREKLLVSDNQKEIGVDDILELRHLASLSSNSGGHKFMVIDGADDMSDTAQNSLLKILEEPPPKTVFILITDSLEGLLPTIVSRTVPMEFSFVADDDLIPLLDESDVGAPKKEKILTISSGRPGIAIRAVSDKDYLENEWLFYESFKKVFDSDALSQFLYSQKICQEPETVEKFLFFLLSELRKKLVFNENYGWEAVGSCKEVFNSSDLLRKTNVNKRMLLDNIFLETCDK
ncbi:MAG: hypothetical protein A3G49_04185 [Candidatus Sungbacteria bacterium RIFCSPLOWO2_12_FULL_41_11]|uniref:DNA polymerase III subunit delta n=1 Tax=Candidatus Sungbacteria bacterium RIFCSPLOWO2_12_FULL_41_11 TaxID=1802286 RepID=A0A1G2LVF2_9BACT|nr:MAG: polymerase III, delta prime subunit protein [Parcubacteria group bacterium GW2011_GWA2_42_14]OHA14859.1 MAG: hypothetical protein A3G49_04185 [Candidatus Sungbacteria bacterium RIFCSPLOWO2_12_FULL_41_11]